MINAFRTDFYIHTANLANLPVFGSGPDSYALVILSFQSWAWVWYADSYLENAQEEFPSRRRADESD